MDTIIFEGLGISVDVPADGVLFSIGSLSVRWYAFMIAIGMILAAVYGFRMMKRYKVNEDKFLNAIIGGVIGGILGARLYYVAFSWETYKDNPISILYIWEGGLAIYGGIIGALLVGGIIAALQKLCVKDCFDIASMGFLIGQCLGRWGNFFNREAFGGNTTLPWGMTSNKIQNELLALKLSGADVDPALPVHPTFLYESLWCLLGFVLLHFLIAKRRVFKGQVILSYCIWYGVGRFVFEGLRTDSLMIGTFRVSQLLSLALVIFGIVFYIVGLARSKNHPIEQPAGEAIATAPVESPEEVKPEEAETETVEEVKVEEVTETEAVEEVKTEETSEPEAVEEVKTEEGTTTEEAE
ncbi:MAG: prolipoprotein diacylglyceryl transferase [Clostridia bacterium]|nr:prolipoprotein diacylglyceryl transferase [Clostridia bacterium]